MKCLIILALVGVSWAALFGTQKEIKVDDGKILINAPGKTILINKPLGDAKSVDITIKDQDTVIKKIRLDDLDKDTIKEVTVATKNEGRLEDQDNLMFLMQEATDDDKMTRGKRSIFTFLRTSMSQMNVLLRIFKKYEGVLGEDSFYQLLKEVNIAVMNKQLHPIIYEILRDLEINPLSTVNTRPMMVPFMLRRTQQPMMGFTPVDARRQDIFLGRDAENDMMEGTDLTMEDEEKMKLNRQIRFIQDLLYDRDQSMDSFNFPQFGTRSKSINLLDNTKKTDMRKMVHQTTVQELQGEIIQKHLMLQRLQLQQQILSQKKHQLKVQVVIITMSGRGEGVEFTKVQGLKQVLVELHKQETMIVEEELNEQFTLIRLEQQLRMTMEELRKDLHDEELELMEFVQ